MKFRGMTEAEMIDLDSLLCFLEKGNMAGVGEGVLNRWKKTLNKAYAVLSEKERK